MNLIFNSDDFRVVFNPDDETDRNYYIFRLFELACLELVERSYKINVKTTAKGLPPYKNFVYSRMFWGKNTSMHTMK